MRAEEFGEIREQEVFEASRGCEVVEDYPEDEPHPSTLVLGRTAKGRALHLLCAYAEKDDRLIVVTVYEPDPSRWDEEFRRRRET